MKKILVLITVLLCAMLLFACASETEQGEVKPPIHKCEFGEWDVIIEPTCVDLGYKIRYCNECGEEQTADIPTVAHTPVVEEGCEPTCESDGYTEPVITFTDTPELQN